MKFSLIVTLFFFLSSVYANNKILNVEFEQVNPELGRVVLKLDKKIEEKLTLQTKKNIIQIEIPNGIVWPKIEKNIILKNQETTKILAYQYNKDIARLRILLPFSSKEIEDKINLKTLIENIVLEFPLEIKVSKNEKSIIKYDETYLNKLLKDSKEEKIVDEEKKIQSLLQEDVVRVKNSAQKKEKIFSENEAKPTIIGKYLGKFLLFFSLVIGLFLGLLFMFKKGVVRKGKIGFLKNNDIVQVVSTTYVGPKKNLLLVKVENQVLLLGSTENQINFLTEIKNVPSVMKIAEKELTGSNFDENLIKGQNSNQNFKIKEDLSKMAEESTKERGSMTDQIRDKLKGLKSLQ